MNLFHFLNGDTALVLSVITGTLIPFLSALATKAPTALTGLISSFLAAVSGFCAEWVASPNHFDWKVGASTALLAWLASLGAQYGWLKDTDVQDRLHSRGPQWGKARHNMHTDAKTPAAG